MNKKTAATERWRIPIIAEAGDGGRIVIVGDLDCIDFAERWRAVRDATPNRALSMPVLAIRIQGRLSDRAD